VTRIFGGFCGLARIFVTRIFGGFCGLARIFVTRVFGGFLRVGADFCDADFLLGVG
jgi:hypothetical protein